MLPYNRQTQIKIFVFFFFPINLLIFFLFTPPRIVEGLYLYCSLSVCLSVCLTLLVNKILAKRMNRFGRGFRLMVSHRTGSNPIEIEIGDLGSKVKVTVI